MLGKARELKWSVAKEIVCDYLWTTLRDVKFSEAIEAEVYNGQSITSNLYLLDDVLRSQLLQDYPRTIIAFVFPSARPCRPTDHNYASYRIPTQPYFTNMATLLPPSDIMPFTEQQTNDGRCHSLNVPAEVRVSIYELLHLPSKANGRASSPNFASHMALSRTCKLFRREVVPAMNGVRTYSASIMTLRKADFQFEGREYSLLKPLEVPALNLNGIRKLTIDIYVDPERLCETQETLYGFVRQLARTRLQHLHVNITHHADDFKYALNDTDFTLGHVMAFIVDPIRTIRHFKAKAIFKDYRFHANGITGRPWIELSKDTRSLIQSDDPVPAYVAITP